MTEKTIKFIEDDKVGKGTLDVIAKADKFNKWMYHSIKPYFKGKVLEIGSGIGNISSQVFDDGFELMVTDIRKEYCNELEKKFNPLDTYLGVKEMNLVDPEFDKKYGSLFGTFDTIFALNVVEHIEDDRLALTNAKKLIREGGHVIILVPAFQFLYNNFDLNLGHYRRYTKRTLSSLFDDTNIQILRKRYFNLIGILGWFVSGKLLRKEHIPGGQMNLYNKLVPVFKLVDKVTFNTAGLSVILYGRKKD